MYCIFKSFRSRLSIEHSLVFSIFSNFTEIKAGRTHFMQWILIFYELCVFLFYYSSKPNNVTTKTMPFCIFFHFGNMTEYVSIGKIMFYLMVCYNFPVHKHMVCEPLLEFFPQASQMIIMTRIRRFWKLSRYFKNSWNVIKFWGFVNKEHLASASLYFSALGLGQIFFLSCFPVLAYQMAPQPWRSRMANI